MPSTSQAPWWELTLQVPLPLADDAAGLLVDAGALGVEVRDCDDAATAELVASYSGEAEPDGLREQARAAVQQIGVDVAPDAMTVRSRSDEAWAESWKAYFTPLRLGERLWVVPSWHCRPQPGDRHGPAQAFEAPAGHLVIELDPGMAFGTGQHATTAVCADVLERTLTARGPAERAALHMLDLGSGSGILAIAAAKIGCGHVLAVDNDPVAVTAAMENCRINGVSDAVHVREGSADATPEQFDLVVANILATTLCELAPLVLQRLRAGGRLILSGILGEQAEEVLQTYDHHAAARGRHALRLLQTHTEGEWVALVLGGE